MEWKIACDMSIPYRAMTIRIGFSHAEKEYDEVEFCIVSWDERELSDLFEQFCKENYFADVSICNISIVRVAESLDILTELEECGRK